MNGGSGVSIGGVRSLRVVSIAFQELVAVSFREEGKPLSLPGGPYDRYKRSHSPR